MKPKGKTCHTVYLDTYYIGEYKVANKMIIIKRVMMQKRLRTRRVRNGVPGMLFAAALSYKKHSSSEVRTEAPTSHPFGEPT